ncbi:MAG: YifB family Mg chelatase-like AAA ATPase [Parcubacteria group bacterium]|nr:YifB family Mg chelatase-like AAA ATPase [Parcubacteria group bacterium]
MKLARVSSAQVIGLRSEIITVEVDLFSGVHSFSVVGLPDKAVEESRDRVASAVKSTGFPSPKMGNSHKVVVSLAPADVKKEGPLFDLPITLAYLLAAEHIRFNPEKKMFLGELALSGELRPMRGALLLAEKAREEGFEEVFVPASNATEAALAHGIKVYGAKTLRDIVDHLNEKRLDEETRKQTSLSGVKLEAQSETLFKPKEEMLGRSFEDIVGQEGAKRGLVIAAAGAHNIAFYGPPGTGKTLLARAFAEILPPLTLKEALEVTRIHSVAGRLHTPLLETPPFRAPHHTASHTAIVGGGSFPRPGEATLAHRGVLFMDEFPEFDKRVLEALRVPLEDGTVSVARVRGSETFPAEFILIAAMNPCPCGFRGDGRKTCICAQSALQKYARKISGPIMDRIDMWVEVPRIDHKRLELKAISDEERQERAKVTTDMRKRVIQARDTQSKRFGAARTNSRMTIRELEQFARLTPEAQKTLTEASATRDISARAYHRIIKLSRTIADLEGSDDVSKNHILEAFQYRPRELFGSL